MKKYEFRKFDLNKKRLSIKSKIKIIYKLDINGCGQLVQKEKIISITQFDSGNNFERFRWMCILSGCDYLENLPGIGLGKAKKLLKTINKSDIELVSYIFDRK